MAGQCARKAPALSLVEPVTAMTVAEALTKLHACWGEIHLDVSRSGVATVANLSSAKRAWSGSHNSLHEREAATSNLDAPRMNRLGGLTLQGIDDPLSGLAAPLGAAN
jgi:hypothetical protein